MTPLLLALAALCLAPIPVPVLRAPAAVPQAPVLHPEKTLQRVVILGASLSGGFGAERPFVDVFQAALRIEPERAPLGLGDVLFFTSPKSIGGHEVEAALDAQPTLVVAIDFLFWFGYGSANAKGSPITDESQRLELLEQGLALLEEFECPLVLGDFPDMSAAVGTMLARAQMPKLTTLPLLSRRVREWAAARPATIVLPLSELVTKLGSKDAIQIGRHSFPAGTKLLQDDHLHPTLEGLVSVAQLACDELVSAHLIPAAAVEPQYEAVLAKLRKSGLARPTEAAGIPPR